MEVARGLLSSCGNGVYLSEVNTDLVSLRQSSRSLCLAALSPISSNLSNSSSSVDSLNISLGSSLDAFRLVQADVVKIHMSSKRKRRLKYYTKLAGRLAEDGHLLEMADLVAMLADAGLNRFNFINAISIEHVHSASSAALMKGQLNSFLAFVDKLHAAGFCASRFVGDAAMARLSGECNDLLVRGEVDKCISLLQTLSGCGIQPRKLVDPRHIIAWFAENRNVDAAIRYASLLPAVNLHFNHMIQEFGNHGDLEAAFAVFDSMEGAGIKPDMYTYRALIDACAQQGDAPKATTVFKEIIQSGNTPNVYVYNSLMNVNAGDVESVWQLYEDMRRVGVEPDLASYNIMLKSCSVSKCAERAKALYSDMERVAATAGLKLDVFTYTTAIHIFGEAKMWDLALKVKEDMIASGVTPNVITWTALLGACGNVGMVEQAFSIFNEMLVSGCVPNAQTYNMLINACCEANQHDRAFLLFKEWKETGKIQSHREREDGECPGVQLGEIFPEEPLLEASKDDVKKSTIRSCQSKPNLVTYNTLMKACGHEPKLVKEIMNTITAVGLTPDRTSWSTLIDAYGSKGYLEEAINAFGDMKEAGITPDLVAYTSIIKACVEAKDSDLAFQFFRELKGVGLRPNKVTYNTLFRAQRTCRKLTEVQRALALYEEMRDAGFAPNDGILRVLLEQWAEGAIEGGGSERASSMKYEREGSAGFSEYMQLLLQKVAVHAQAKDLEPKLIDLHGLSRGEARTAVLAVLRIIKERHSQGHPIKDDLVIITGIGRRSESPGNSVIRNAVLHVLEDELGIPVTCGPTEVRIVRKMVRNHLTSEGEGFDRHSSNNKLFIEGKHLVVETETTSVEDDQSECLDLEDMCDSPTGKGDRAPSFVARKPTNFGRLIVAKDALEAWLLKKRTKGVAGKKSLVLDTGKTV